MFQYPSSSSIAYIVSWDGQTLKVLMVGACLPGDQGHIKEREKTRVQEGRARTQRTSSVRLVAGRGALVPWKRQMWHV